jgi:hypothetical protein
MEGREVSRTAVEIVDDFATKYRAYRERIASLRKLEMETDRTIADAKTTLVEQTDAHKQQSALRRYSLTLRLAVKLRNHGK